MSTTLGVLALVLLGAEGAPKEAAPQICYEFRVLEMTGVEWREGVYASLQPVTRQGSATLWTTTDAVAAAITKKADRVVSAPKVTSFSEAPAHINTKVSRGVVTHLSRHADGPVNHATKVVYSPETEKIRDGLTTTVAGRKLDQGVLVKLVLDDTRVTAVHPVYLTESREPKDTGDHKQMRWEQVQVKLEVPEVNSTDLAGEWLIPKDGVLVASLGAHCVADSNGKAVVRERLVLVKAEAVLEPVAIGIAPPRGTVLSEPHKPPMPAPSAPSRTLPQGLNAEGEPVPLPPLPPETPAPTARPDSAEPVATPQSKHDPKAKDHRPESATPDAEAPTPEVDAKAKKAAFWPESAPYLPPGPAFPWANTQAAAARARMRAAGVDLASGECCEAPQRKVSSIPEPLPEGAVPAPLPQVSPRPQPEFHKQVVALLRAVEQLRMVSDEWSRFWMIDEPMLPFPSQRDEGTAAPPPPARPYEFRWPLNGIDVEVRITPRRGEEPTSRATWRPSGQADSAKK